MVALALGGLVSGLAGSEPIAAQAELLRAVAQSPSLGAAARRVMAAQARIDSAGRLPDPEVEGMASRMDGPMGERATMYELTLRQPLPRRGERAADRDRAVAAVSMAEAELALMAGEMAADTAMAIAEVDAAEARIVLLEEQRARLASVLRSMEVRLAAGSNVRLADRLTLETRVATMQLMVEEERRMAEDAQAEARGRLGLAPGMPLPGFAAPAVGDVSPTEAAALRVTAARAEEAGAMVKMAQASSRPMTAVGLRLERERTGMGDEDTIGLALMSEIPWRSRRYAAAEVRAAEADRGAAQADGEAARYRIQSSLTRVERAERLAESARRLGAETRKRLDAEYDSLVQSAAVAGARDSAIFQVVELLEKASDTDLQVVQAELAARVARAELWRYLPVDRFAVIFPSSSP